MAQTSSWFAARFEADGELGWATGFTGEGEIYPDAAAALPDGSAAIIGSFTGRAMFEAGLTQRSVVASEGDSDAFVVLLAP